MRLAEIAIVESTTVDLGDDPDVIREFARRHCQPWLSRYGTDVRVYRGSSHHGHTAFHRSIRVDRRPMNTNFETNRLFNEWIRMAGGVANRNNSAFVTSHIAEARQYGNVYRVMPMGEFHYTWHREAYDWFHHYGSRFWQENQWHLMDPQRLMEWVQANRPQQWEDFLRTKPSPLSPLTFLSTMMNSRNGLTLRHNLEVDPLEVSLYDPQKIREVIAVDQDLEKAVEQGHEIMIHAREMLYIPKDFEL